ncbi:Uncharacterized protein HZ326_1269 [Fusarium oxysporum f. sp. albedinis]|nr:Uncharacterized protein HZ326_1269 [Fusarium oxysporum f. sp. albedinis]
MDFMEVSRVQVLFTIDEVATIRRWRADLSDVKAPLITVSTCRFSYWTTTAHTRDLSRHLYPAQCPAKMRGDGISSLYGFTDQDTTGCGFSWAQIRQQAGRI